jgi:tetratricopeptide (TPR) repeat protein
VVVVIFAAILLIIRSQVPKEGDTRADQAANQMTLEMRKEINRGRVLYNEGKYEESLEVFRAILQKDPSVKAARIYSQMADEKHRVALARKAEEEKAAQIAARLDGARQAFGKQNFEAAISDADSALDLDPGNAEAKKISSEARRRLALEKRAELKKARQKPGSAGLPVPPPAAADTAPAVAAPRPAVAPNTPATIHLVFSSPIPKGFLMVAINDQIIYRKNFDFGKEKSGTITDTLHAAPGSSTVKVWLTTPDASVKGYQPLPVTFAPGDNRTLTLTLQGSKFGAGLP